MRKIDLETWERKSHYKWFSSFADPTLAMDVKMDVTEILRYCKENGISSYAAIMYVISESMNRNSAFRLRVLNGEIIEIDRANVAYTIMVNESCFVNCRARVGYGFDLYIQDVKNNQEKYNNSNFIQEEYNDTAIVDDVYCSCIPWTNFLSLRQPIPDKLPESWCIPRAAWGKYYKEGERTYMTLNLTASHALVDGIDFSRVFDIIQSGFSCPEKFIGESKA